MYLLDTNVCIDFLLGRSDVLAQRMADNFGALAISSITAAELLVGSRTSTDEEEDERRTDKFIASVDVIDFSLDDARVYGEIVREIGVRRKSFDRLIGVQAVRLGLTLVTRDSGHFSDLPGLSIENWTTGLQARPDTA